MSESIIDREQLADAKERADRFDRFVRDRQDILVRFVRRHLPTEEDAQDVAQESLIRLIQYRDHEPELWSSILYRIAINVLHDRGRRARTRQASSHVSLDDNARGLFSADQPHEKQIETQQELARVQKALLGLPARCRDIYLLNRIEGMSYPEIARHSGVSVKAVEKQISKALALLRKSLGDRIETGKPV